MSDGTDTRCVHPELRIVREEMRPRVPTQAGFIDAGVLTLRQEDLDIDQVVALEQFGVYGG
jgi:hypothetical protein